MRVARRGPIGVQRCKRRAQLRRVTSRESALDPIGRAILPKRNAVLAVASGRKRPVRKHRAKRRHESSVEALHKIRWQLDSGALRKRDAAEQTTMREQMVILTFVPTAVRMKPGAQQRD